MADMGDGTQWFWIFMGNGEGGELGGEGEVNDGECDREGCYA